MHEMILILLIKDGFEWETPKCKVLDKFSFQWYQWILWNVNSLPRSTIKLELEGFVDTHSEVRTWSFSVHLEENLEKEVTGREEPLHRAIAVHFDLFAVCCLLGRKKQNELRGKTGEIIQMTTCVVCSLLDSHAIPIWKQFSLLCENSP